MKKAFLYILLLLLPLCAVAQERKVQNKPYIDFRRLHYGFFVGVHLQDMEFENNGYVTENGETWYADIASYNPGFSVGVLADLRLNTYLSLRAIPTMHFGQNSVTFREQKSGEISKQSIKTTYIALPVHVKYSAERFNNYRPYITAGVSPMVNLTLKKQQQLLLKNFDLMIDLCKKLSAGIPFLRVDLYEINGKVYFGELTFYPGSGFTPLEPKEWDDKIGSWLVLPAEKTTESK